MGNDVSFIKDPIAAAVAEPYQDLAAYVTGGVFAALRFGGYEHAPVAALAAGISVAQRIRDLRAAAECDHELVEVLSAPLLERARRNEPAEMDPADRALAMLVVRNCPLFELTHATLGREGMGGEAVRVITTGAARLVVDAWRAPVQPGAHPEPYLALRHEFADAWQLFSALAEAERTGAGEVFYTPSGRRPTPYLVSDRPRFDPLMGAYTDSGGDPRIPLDLWRDLVRVGPGGVVYVREWTRLGRGCQRLFRVVDALLTREIGVETEQVYAGGGVVRVRRAHTDPGRLSGRTPGEAEPPGAGGGSDGRNEPCPCRSGWKQKRCCVISPTLPADAI